MAKNVHTEHCCVIHGCKYGEEDCPVATKKQPQSFPCEECGTDNVDPTKLNNYINPCKSSIGEYTSEELYQIVVEELPKLRAIAEAAQTVRQFGKDDVAYDLPVEQNLLPALKQWEDCIGSQADAKHG